MRRQEVTSRFVCKRCERKGIESIKDVNPPEVFAPYHCPKCRSEMKYVGGRIGGGTEKSRTKSRLRGNQ